jgi:hypothetical protein
MAASIGTADSFEDNVSAEPCGDSVAKDSHFAVSWASTL